LGGDPTAETRGAIALAYPSGQIDEVTMLANIPVAMPQYILFVCNQHNRIKYPESFDLPDIDAACDAA
jgi:hypothetical protein